MADRITVCLTQRNIFRAKLTNDFDPWQVIVDGTHHCHFFHRVNFLDADALYVVGDVKIQLVQFKQPVPECLSSIKL